MFDLRFNNGIYALVAVLLIAVFLSGCTFPGVGANNASGQPPVVSAANTSPIIAGVAGNGTNVSGAGSAANISNASAVSGNPAGAAPNETGPASSYAGNATDSGQPQEPEPPPLPSSIDPSIDTYNMSEVATHNTPSDCWLAIYGEAYNITWFAATYPNDVMDSYCGQDATSAFESAQNGSSAASRLTSDALFNYDIGGALGDENAPGDNYQEYTAAALATHNSPSDCWVEFYYEVYNITGFVAAHAETAPSLSRCGSDITAAFEDGSLGWSEENISAYQDDLINYDIGWIASNDSAQ